jgi:hypothetical protein
MCCEGDLQDIGLIIHPLGSLLSGVRVNQHDVPVRPIHTSFRDFLMDENCSGKFHVDLSLGHKSLAIACLETMKHGLKFNICNLSTSYLHNKDVNGLAICIKNSIPAQLTYSCQFWADHLLNTPGDDAMLGTVNEFFNTRLLYWLEVLSLTGQVNIASPAMMAIADWSEVSEEYYMFE